MAENNLISLPQGTIKEFTPDQFKAVGKASDYLPRFALFGSSTNACKQGLIPVGNYGVTRSKTQVDDLGKEVDILVVCGRAKALKIDPVTGVITTNFDPDSDTFQKIVADSSVEDSGCMYGPEFLVYIPVLKEFATLYLSSPTGRSMSGSVYQRLEKAATMKPEFIKGRKHSWHGPVCVPCTTPFDVPPMDLILKMVAKFEKDTEEAQPELAPASPSGGGRAV